MMFRRRKSDPKLLEEPPRDEEDSAGTPTVGAARLSTTIFDDQEDELPNPATWGVPEQRVGTRLETDPTGRTASMPGAKLDAGKPLTGVLADFSLALAAVADVGTFGANKYTRRGWEKVPDGIARYYDAKWRHLLKERHEEFDPDSGLLHAAHEAWNTLARLELILRARKES